MIKELLSIQKMLTSDFVRFLKEYLLEVSAGLSDHDRKLMIENRIGDDETFVTRINELLGIMEE